MVHKNRCELSLGYELRIAQVSSWWPWPWVRYHLEVRYSNLGLDSRK